MSRNMRIIADLLHTKTPKKTEKITLQSTRVNFPYLETNILIQNLKDESKRKEIERLQKEEKERQRQEMLEKIKNYKVDTLKVQSIFGSIVNNVALFPNFQAQIKDLLDSNNFKEFNIDYRPEVINFILTQSFPGQASLKVNYLDWNSLFHYGYIFTHIFGNLNDPISQLFYEKTIDCIKKISDRWPLDQQVATYILYFCIFVFSKKDIFEKYLKPFIKDILKNPIQQSDQRNVLILYSFSYTCACRLQKSDTAFYNELEKSIPEDIVLPITPKYSLQRVLRGQDTPHFYERFCNFDKCDPAAQSDEECFPPNICRDFNWF